MINRKCPKCGGKVKRSFDFCPKCGHNLRRERDEKNYGLLGRDDSSIDQFGGLGLPGGFGNIFNNLMQQIDREFRELDREMGKRKKPQSRGVSINISTGTGKKPEIKVRGYGPGFKKGGKKIKKDKGKKKRVKQPKISDKKAKQVAKMPREEAETNVRRLSDKLIYEIKLPGVSSINNVGINRLENSIEIKAVGKDKVYFKLLPVSTPIKNYKMKDGKLVLELRER